MLPFDNILLCFVARPMNMAQITVSIRINTGQVNTADRHQVNV